MGEIIKKDEINRSHRLGATKNNSKSRPIIAKFVKYNRCRIFKENKKLKGKSLSVTESLTKKCIETLKKAKEEYGFENVWLVKKRFFIKM